MLDRQMPNSPEMERATIACLLWEPDKCIDVVSSLSVEDFYTMRYRQIFEHSIAIVNSGKTLDLPALADSIGNGEELREIRHSVSTVANIHAHVAAVKNYTNARRLITTCANAINEAYAATAAEIPGLVDATERSMFDIGKTSKEEGFKHIRQLMPRITESIHGMIARDPKFMGIPTTFAEIDRWITGLRDEEIIVLAARPSLGKTSLALNMQRRIAANQIPVAIVSLEMGGVKLGQRQIFETAQLDIRRVARGDLNRLQLADLTAAYDKLAALPIFSYDSSPDWATVRRRIRQAVREHGVKVVFIDYLQLLRLGKRTDSREREVATLSSEMKELAMELSIPIVVLAQLNREAESRAPRISDLRESGAIEQDADIVILLDRKRTSEDVETAKVADSGGGIPVQAVVAKNRNGATGTGHLLFFQQFTRFEDEARTDDFDKF